MTPVEFKLWRECFLAAVSGGASVGNGEALRRADLALAVITAKFATVVTPPVQADVKGKRR